MNKEEAIKELITIWIPVSTRLPLAAENYLICYGVTMINIAFYTRDGWRLINSGEYVTPTHWMPLPAAPSPERVSLPTGFQIKSHPDGPPLTLESTGPH